MYRTRKVLFFEELGSAVRAFIMEAHDLHTQPAYPEDKVMYESFKDPEYVRMVYVNTLKLFKGLYVERKGTGSGSGCP